MFYDDDTILTAANVIKHSDVIIAKYGVNKYNYVKPTIEDNIKKKFMNVEDLHHVSIEHL